MPSVTVRVIGDKAVRAAIQKLARLAPQKLARAVAESAINIQAEARKNVPVDVGFLRSSIVMEFENGQLTGAVGTNAKYAPSVEFGAKPHFPPVAPLEEWARRHGMPGAGFAIAKKISERGTPAQPFLFPAFEGEKDNFIRNVKDAVIEAAKESAS